MMTRIFIVCIAMLLAACGSQPKINSLLSIDYRLVETRYCGKAERDAKVVAAFRRIHACPSTGLKTGACPDWQVDHVIPRDSGGCDVVSTCSGYPYGSKHALVTAKTVLREKFIANPLKSAVRVASIL